jgi:hypothetical protein
LRGSQNPLKLIAAGLIPIEGDSLAHPNWQKMIGVENNGDRNETKRNETQRSE